MSRNNDVFQILVTKGNKTPLAKDSKVTDLTPGQIGVFNADTNISVDATSTDLNYVRNFYLAVGLDRDNDGVTDDISKSVGYGIQKKNMVHYSYRSYSAPQPMKVLLKDYTADCETEYGVKLELKNEEIYRTQGYNQFTKTYSIVTSCCSGCTPTCPSGDSNEITKLLAINVGNDESGLIKVNILPRGNVSAAGVTPDANGYLTIGDVETILAYNASQPDNTTFVYTDIEFETVPKKINSFCSINLLYFYPRQTFVNISKIEGFECNGTLEVTQELAYEEGNGADIKQLEYKSKGWTDGPYRVSTLNGVAFDRSYNTDETQKYSQIALTYDQFSVGAWLEYLNNEATIIAIPEEDIATRDGLLAIIDPILGTEGFSPLADDAAASNIDITAVEPTTDIDNVDEDGIS